MKESNDPKNSKTAPRRILHFAFCILIFAGLVPAAIAAPPIALGSPAFYTEAADTILTVDCPSDGILMVGGMSLGPSGHWVLMLDGDTVAGCAGTSTRIVSPGEHEVKIDLLSPGNYSLCSFHLWAIFWAEDTGSVAVAEPPRIAPATAVSALYRVGDVVKVETLDAAVYDASGRLVERPVGFWMPAMAGTYFLADEQMQKIVVVE